MLDEIRGAWGSRSLVLLFLAVAAGIGFAARASPSASCCWLFIAIVD
jgi:hypothetical protein